MQANAMIRAATGLLVVSGALMLFGCTATVSGVPVASRSEAPSTPTTSMQTPEPIMNPTLEQLHEQYVASGLPCTWGVTDDGMLGATVSGRCADTENVISTFPSQSDVDALLKLNSDSVEPGLFLVGPTWVVSAEHPEDLITAHRTMGGTLWPADAAVFADK
jgi:hypothetical protein